MKKSDKLRKQTRKLIVKNLIIVITLAVVAFVGAFSWFKDEPDADATGITVTAEVHDGLEFYIMPPRNSSGYNDVDQYGDIKNRLADNAAWNTANPSATPRRTTWHKGSDPLVFDFADQEFKFMDGLFLCEVTGDGKTFSVPKLIQNGKLAYVDTTQAFDTAIADEEYMSFDIYFRSESSHDVVLLSDTSITPSGTIDPSDEEGMKDAAVGAVRMSVVNGSTRELLWIPYASVWYNGDTDVLYTGITSENYSGKGPLYLDTTDPSNPVISLRTTEGTNDHAYYDTSRVRQKLTTASPGQGNLVASATGTLGSFGTNNVVLTLNNDGSDGYYYGHIRVNLWIEGEDAEARLAFVGGKFTLYLHFDIIEG